MRGTCRCCKNEYSINADGTVRYHLAADPECHESADSRKCRGVGQRPEAPGPAPLPGETDADFAEVRAEHQEHEADPTGYVCRVPAGPQGCGRPVQLTANRRARSHLDPQGQPCGGGSDWPLAVDAQGVRTDTAPQGEVLPAAAPEDLRMSDVATAGDGSWKTDPHAREADAAIAEADSIQREQDAAYEQSVRDGLTESRTRQAAETSRLTKEVIEVLQRQTPEQKLARAQRMDRVASEALGLPLDPELCTHPEGFRPTGPDGDDLTEADAQSTFPACPHCGLIETEEVGSCTCDPGPEGQHQGHCGHVPVDPGPPDWRTPPDLLAQMPEGVRRLAEDNPECWECRHEVIPLVDHFGPDGRPRVIVWGCSRNCEHSRKDPAHHPGRPCRPQHPAEDRLGNLAPGATFRRHVTRGDGLVYRVQSLDPATQIIRATVISAGPHAGRTGELTNLQEDITCTDQDGKPRPRRDHPAPGTSAPAADRPTSNGPSGSSAPEVRTPQSPDPTPSAPSKTPSPTSGPSSRPDTKASAAPRSASGTERSGKATRSVPSAAESTRTATASRTTVPDAFATPKAATNESDKYDSYGRYKLLHPKTGKAVKWTRATTYAKSISDTYALSLWSQRMVLKGCALRPDIVAAAGTLDVKADKDRMNSLVDEAKKAAGDKVAANKGTAVHAYTEDRDRAWVGIVGETRDVPADYVPTVDAYEAVLRAFGLEPVPGLIEFTTAVLQYEVAGTSDRVYRVTRDLTFDLNGRPVTLYAGEYVIGDVKTGADLSYGWREIAIQLALYAQGINTCGTWSWESRQWSRPVTVEDSAVQLQVRTDVGIVPHLPVDRTTTKAPLATLYAVDLSAGWAATVLCGQVRSWRKERTLATPLEIADVVADRTVPVRVHSAPASRPATLEDKAKAVTSRAEASAVFQEATGARVSRAELDRLVGLMQAKLTSHVEQGA